MGPRQVCRVAKREACEAGSAVLDAFNRERCDQAVVPNFGDMQLFERVLCLYERESCFMRVQSSVRTRVWRKAMARYSQAEGTKFS